MTSGTTAGTIWGAFLSVFVLVLVSLNSPVQTPSSGFIPSVDPDVYAYPTVHRSQLGSISATNIETELPENPYTSTKVALPGSWSPNESINKTLLPLPMTAHGVCKWIDTKVDNLPIINVQSGLCDFADIASSDNVKVHGGVALVWATIVVEADAVLNITSSDVLKLRLASTGDRFVNIEVNGATLRIDGVTVESYDPETGKPDTNLADGRSFIRVDAFIDKDGQKRNAHFEMTNSAIRYLGYETRNDPNQYTGYGLSLKVRSEEQLSEVAITGAIYNSLIEHNYRGFYSYGARDIIFTDNIVVFNKDYGVDPHDDSTGFVARRNLIAFNDGTGLAISRRCSNAVIADNYIIGNGANGIIVHDLSNNTSVQGNVVMSNNLDGIVIHDSNNVTVSNNKISLNRNGIRVFAGSTLVDVSDNEFQENRETSVVLLPGWLEQVSDLSDYSEGTKWNAKNISRHNDGRVRGVKVQKNTFNTKATLTLSDTDFVELSGNKFLDDVVFLAHDSDNLTLDGFDAVGEVTYLLRRNDPKPLSYNIRPKDGSRISIMAGDTVVLSGSDVFLPADNTNFTLHLLADHKPKIIAQGLDPFSIQTGVLKTVPLGVNSGSATISSYIGDFERYQPARVEMTTTSWDTLALSSSQSGCNLVEWRIDDRFTTDSQPFVFFSLASEDVQISRAPITRSGRLIADIRCIANALPD